MTLSLAIPPELVDAIASRVVALLAEQTADTGPPHRASDAEAGRVTLSKTEAAESLGVSVDHLERHVLPHLRVVRSGRLRLIPVTELDRWVQENAARALGGSR